MDFAPVQKSSSLYRLRPLANVPITSNALHRAPSGKARHSASEAHSFFPSPDVTAQRSPRLPLRRRRLFSWGILTNREAVPALIPSPLSRVLPSATAFAARTYVRKQVRCTLACVCDNDRAGCFGNCGPLGIPIVSKTARTNPSAGCFGNKGRRVGSLFSKTARAVHIPRAGKQRSRLHSYVLFQPPTYNGAF